MAKDRKTLKLGPTQSHFHIHYKDGPQLGPTYEVGSLGVPMVVNKWKHLEGAPKRRFQRFRAPKGLGRLVEEAKEGCPMATFLSSLHDHSSLHGHFSTISDHKACRKIWRYVEIDCKVVWNLEVWWWCKRCISWFRTQVNPCKRTSACLQQNRVVEFGIFVLTVISGFKPWYWKFLDALEKLRHCRSAHANHLCHTLERGERWTAERDQRISQLCKERWNLETEGSSQIGLQQF